MDLSTTYMGLKLASPIVPSASPLSRDIENIRKMEQAGASAVVLWSLFEEQFQHDATEVNFYLHYGADRFAESLSYFPTPHEYHFEPQEYLKHIAAAKKAVRMPIIASLNGISTKGWISFARQIEQAGADGIEINAYFIPTNPLIGADHVEQAYLKILRAVKAVVKIPVAMKLSPFFSSMAGMASELDKAGADALVLFNRFYQPDIDPYELKVVPGVVLSTSTDSRLTQRWIALLHGRLRTSLAATGGVHTAEDVVKMLMAGADVTMLCSALLIHGIGHIETVARALPALMERLGYSSVAQMKGVMSHKTCPEPAAFERANYMHAITSFGKTATAE